MPLTISNRIQKLNPSPTLAITNLANQLKAQGKDVIGLGAGEPDFDTPEVVKSAAIEALKDGKTKYSAVNGLPAMREAIVEKFHADLNLKYEADSIVLSNGGKHSLFNLFLAALNPGDEVIIPAPYWVSYPEMVGLAEAVPVIIQASQQQDYKINADQLEQAISGKTRMLILNSPSNPTGSLYSKDELEALAAVLEKHPDIMICSDDIYEKNIYPGGDFVNLAMINEEMFHRTVIINGMSKAYSMTGWRMGYAVSPDKALAKAMSKLQGQSTSNVNTFIQYGGMQALKEGDKLIAPMLEAFLERRDFVVSKLQALPGVSINPPAGAFYVFPDVSGISSLPGLQKLKERYSPETRLGDLICTYLLEDYLVAAVPGSGFGYDNGLRLSYATSMAQLEKALQRMAEAWQSLA